MQRVKFDIDCDEQQFSLAMVKDPGTSLTSVKVVAKGKTFSRETLHNKGSSQPEECRNTDEELIEKFEENVSRVLAPNETRKVVDTVFELEKLDNASKLMEMVTQ